MERKNAGQNIVRVVTPDGWIRPVRVPKRALVSNDAMVSFLVHEGHLDIVPPGSFGECDRAYVPANEVASWSSDFLPPGVEENDLLNAAFAREVRV